MGTQPLFPGYIFLETADDEFGTEFCLSVCRETSGFIRFLPSTRRAARLSGRDLELTRRFIQGADGNELGLSQAFFDENDRIAILSGPLLGLEGSIVKVDRRKKRIKVRLDLYQESHLVDFGYEAVQSI
jgi:transcriptional antiterminator NusG